MAEDNTINAGVRMRQGANELEVGSTGTLSNYGNLANTGTITNSSTGTTVQQVTAATTGVAIKAYGYTTVATTSGAKAHTIAAPIVGVEAVIAAIGSTGGAVATIVPAGATVSFDTTGNRKISMGHNAYVRLVGVSATKFAVAGKSTGVTLAGT